MGRHRKCSSEEMMNLTKEYFESTQCCPDLLSYKAVSEYAVAKGLDVSPWNLSRNDAVKDLFTKLRTLYLNPDSKAAPALAYKTLDVDSLLHNPEGLTGIRIQLMRQDRSWKKVYDNACEIRKENSRILKAKAEMDQKVSALLQENRQLQNQLSESNRMIEILTDKNKKLNNYIKKYVNKSMYRQLVDGKNPVFPDFASCIDPSAVENLIQDDLSYTCGRRNRKAASSSPEAQPEPQPEPQNEESQGQEAMNEEARLFAGMKGMLA